MTTFDTALAFIWSADRDGHQQDSAMGEQFRTSWGVTQMTWDSAVADGIVSGDLADATRDQCAAIYRARYWNALRCSQLSPGVALVCFVDGTLTGVGHVAKLLQRIVGTTPDGSIGPMTLSAARAYAHGDQRALVNALIDADEAYLAALANAPLFIHGWTRREEALRAAALAVTPGLSATKQE